MLGFVTVTVSAFRSLVQMGSASAHTRIMPVMMMHTVILGFVVLHANVFLDLVLKDCASVLPSNLVTGSACLVILNLNL